MKKLHIAARNILILKEIENIYRLLQDKILLIKGGFLLFSSYSVGRYDYDRPMDDIDFITLEKDIVEIKNTLLTNGYQFYPDGKYVFCRERSSIKVPIDIHTELWYMEENLLENAVQGKIKIASDEIVAYSLPYEEHLFLIFIDGIVHYDKKRSVLRNDIKYFISIFKNEIDFDVFYRKLDRYHLRKVYEELSVGDSSNCKIYDIAQSLCSESHFLLQLICRVDSYTRGFMLQLVLLPTISAKIRYLCRKLFPGKSFIQRRYNLRSSVSCCIYFIFRPMILFYLFLKNLISSQLDCKFARVKGYGCSIK